MIVIERKIFLPDVTIGHVWDTESPFKAWSVENPWEYNQRNVSCIPEGHYRLKYVDGLHKRGAEWVILDVLNRSSIEFHVANTADDVEGCIGLGRDLYVFSGQRLGVTHSALTMQEFNNTLLHVRAQEMSLFITKGRMS